MLDFEQLSSYDAESPQIPHFDNMHETKAKPEAGTVEVEQTMESKEATMLELEQLPNYNAELPHISHFDNKA